MRQILAGIGLSLLAASLTAPVVAQTASMAGTWKLNKDQSDDPNAKLRSLLEKGPTVVDGMRSGGGRVRSGAGGLDREESAARNAAAASGAGAAALRSGPYLRVMRPSAQIIVVQTDSTVTISDDASVPQILYIDGRKVEEPLPGAENMMVTARLKDNKLTVERKLGSAGSIRETYTLDAAKKRLVVEARITNGDLQGTLDVKRVYDGN
jgi:hypothetical protein